MSFVLTKEAERDSQKALKALIAHEKKEHGDKRQAIYLIINTDKPLAKQNDHVPRIMLVENL